MNICMSDVMSKELQLNSLTESKVFNAADLPQEYNYARYVEVLENESAPFGTKMKLFLEICDNEPNYIINKVTNILCEDVRNQISKEIVPSTKKVRNGHATDNMNRHKIGTAVKAEITKAKQAASKMGGGAKKSTAPAQEPAKEEMVLMCLDKMYNALTESEAAYTIIKNHKNLSKRFNFNQYIKENSYDIKDCIFELCGFIDTYDIAYGVKYKVALENIQYALFKNAINCDSKAILETVTDYFLLSPKVLTEDHIKDMVKVIGVTNGYNKDELNSLKSFLTESDEDKKNDTDFLAEELDLQYMYQDAFVNNILNESKDDKKNGKEEIEKLIGEFKKLPQKTPEALKALLYKIYTRSPDDIIDETPNILGGCVRFLIIVGALSAGIVPGIIAIIVDGTLKLTLSRKQMKKLIEKYNKEIEKCDKKIDKLKSEKSIEAMEKYKDSLEDAVSKFEDYQYDLGTGEVEDEDEDDDDDDDFNFDESSFLLDALNQLITIEEGISSLNNMSNNYIDSAIAMCANKIDTDCITAFTNIACNKPSIINPKELKRTYSNRLSEMRGNNSKDYFKIDTLNSSIYDLDHIEIKESEYTIEDAISDIDLIHEIIEVLDTNNIDYVNEFSITNSLKLASENLKRGMKTLSDKDKIISRNIDSSVNVAMKAGEQALRSGNREAVIKGRLLPSASKTIKTAIAMSVGWLISPAVAVIGLIGWIACSRKMRAQERQLILDEIETELTVVDKQIKMAEDKDDTAALRNLLTIQRNLQRQRQRIRYKMKVSFGQDAQTRTSDLGKTTTTLKTQK